MRTLRVARIALFALTLTLVSLPASAVALLPWLFGGFTWAQMATASVASMPAISFIAAIMCADGSLNIEACVAESANNQNSNGTAPAKTTPSVMMVNLITKPDQRRVNPDPKRFENDPADANKIQPKATYTPDAAPLNPTVTALFQSHGGAGESVAFLSGVVGVTNGYYHMKTSGPFDTLAQAQASVPAGYALVWANMVTVVPTWPVGKYGAAMRGPSAPDPTACPAGYAKNGSNCELVMPAVVVLPDNTPCEPILQQGSPVQYDPRNLDCEEILDAVENAANPNAIRMVSRDGGGAVTSAVEVSRNPDNNGAGLMVCHDDGTREKCLKTGPLDPSTNSYPTSEIAEGPSKISPPAGGGDDGGSESGGTPGVTCGGPGQPKCAVDIEGVARESTLGEIRDSLRGLIDPSAEDLAELEQKKGEFNAEQSAKGAADFEELKALAPTADDYRYTSAFTPFQSMFGVSQGGQCDNAYWVTAFMSRPLVLEWRELCREIAPVQNWAVWILVGFLGFRSINRLFGGADNVASGVAMAEAASRRKGVD